MESNNDDRGGGGAVHRFLWYDRGFLLLWGGQSLSLLADAAVRIVVLIWVYQRTRSGVAVSLVGLAEAVPLLLLGPLAGVFVDRWSRAATMAGAALARALLLGLLVVAPGHATLALIVLVILLANAASQFFQPAATAAGPVVLGPARAGQANGLLALVTGGIAVTVPGPAALLFAAAGPRRTLALLALLYLLAAPLLARVPARRVHRGDGPRTAFVDELREGLGYVRRSRLLRGIAVVTGLTMLGIGALSVLDVVFVTRALHLPVATAGVLFTAMGAGEAVGSVLVSLMHGRLRRHYHQVLSLAVLANGLCNVAYAGAPTLVVAALLMGGVGLSLPAIAVASTTLVQRATDDRVMGRVVGVIGTISSVAMIASTVGGGVLVDRVGVRVVIGGAATLLVVAALVAYALLWTLPLSVTSFGASFLDASGQDARHPGVKRTVDR